jgi:hypothetical protein
MKIIELWKQYSLFQSHNVTATPSLSSVKGMTSICLKTGYTLTFNVGYNEKVKTQTNSATALLLAKYWKRIPSQTSTLT